MTLPFVRVIPVSLYIQLGSKREHERGTFREKKPVHREVTVLWVLLVSKRVTGVLVETHPDALGLQEVREETPTTLLRRLLVPETVHTSVYIWGRDILLVLGVRRFPQTL